MGYFPVALKGNLTFINNTGPAFRVSVKTGYIIEFYVLSVHLGCCFSSSCERCSFNIYGKQC